MTTDAPTYGLWTLVVLNAAIFLMFAFSFFKPQTGRDWRTFGAFAAFAWNVLFHAQRLNALATSAQIQLVIAGLGYPAKARPTEHDEKVRP